MSDPQGKARQWQFDWKLLVFAGVFLPLLIGLGLWQLDRAGQKQQMLDQWQQDAAVLAWPELAAQGLDSGRPMTLTGMYGDHSWLLDNRTRDGIPGYEVLTAFHPLEGPPVLVNRGWIQAPRTREQLPVFDTPEGIFSLAGRLSDYPQPPVLGEQPMAKHGWPRRVQSLPREVALKEIPGLPDSVVRLADSDQPGALRADWTPDLMGPQTHYGYAAQWFALALALTILTVVASYRKTGANNDNDNG
ncbi:SURF1 family protein [Marinobacter sediminum]|uniref:SURF1 family protein n=1 Tax=Marinobacter sediminum TaxID=256323 RepID=UPI00202E3688|nr:SURF1 family protein [Marinobacter sediminum]MCM0613944.1 SURF1 family protein [Marinobacter sediminum]